MMRFILIFLALQHLAFAQEKSIPVSQVSSFELPDQHDKVRQVQFPRGKSTMFIVSDQKGSKQIEPWVRPVRQRYDTRIEIDGVADMTPVPKRLRGVVRRAFKDELDYSVMLDWDGTVARGFHYIKDKANVFIVDPSGKVLFHTAGPASKEQLQKVFGILDSAVKDKP